MKKQSNILFFPLSANELRKLVTILDETIATDLPTTKPKVFSAAELWNIQRQKKTVRPGKYLL